MEDESVLTRAAGPPDAQLQYGDHPDQVADIRFGAAPAPGRPLLTLFHGGFWKPQYDRRHTGPMACALAAAGWTVMTLEYRRLPGDPEATLGDLRQALIRLPGKVKNHDGRILGVGHSAGGHLALCAAARAGAPWAGVLALAPVTDLRNAERLDLGGGAVGSFLGGPADARGDLDPARLPPPGCPVTVLHGTADETVPVEQGRGYCASHPGARWAPVEGCGHYALIDPLSAAWAQVLLELQRLAPPSPAR